MNASAISLNDFQEWLEIPAAKGGMSATCRAFTVTAAELVETYEELAFDDEHVRSEGKDDTKRVVRRLKKSAKRKSVHP